MENTSFSLPDPVGPAVILFLERKRIKKNFTLATGTLQFLYFPHGNDRRFERKDRITGIMQHFPAGIKRNDADAGILSMMVSHRREHPAAAEGAVGPIN